MKALIQRVAKASVTGKIVETKSWFNNYKLLLRRPETKANDGLSLFNTTLDLSLNIMKSFENYAFIIAPLQIIGVQPLVWSIMIVFILWNI